MTVNTATTQSLTLTSSGTAPVTVSSVTISGTGFTIIGGSSFPVTLNPMQSLTLQVQYLPTSTGTAQRSDHDQQQLVDGVLGPGGSERYECGGAESAVDGERCES